MLYLWRVKYLESLIIMNVKAKGYVLGIVAAATYGMNPLFALPLYKAGMNPDSVLFFRYLFAIPVLGAMIKLRGRDFKLKRKEILPLIIMGPCIASTLLFVYPIMVALIMAFLFKEKLTLQTILCIMLALGGIALLYKSEDGSVLSLTGVILVIASALSYAIYIVAVNRPLLREIATLKLTFYVLVFGLSLFLVRVDFGASLRVVDTWYLWGNLVALAVFPTAISFLCTTQAIQYIGSTPTAILGALEPLTAVFFGVMIFGEPFTPRVGCGIMMIVFAVTIIVAGSNVTTYLVRFRKLFPKLPTKRKPTC